MPSQVDDAAMRELKEVTLPSAKPAQEIPERVTAEGITIPAKTIPGRTNMGTLPLKEIPYQEYPRIVYKHPAKPWKSVVELVDGHGNKEWRWKANEATSRKVANENELRAALKQGFKTEVYITPPMPEEEPEEAAIRIRAENEEMAAKLAKG